MYFRKSTIKIGTLNEREQKNIEVAGLSERNRSLSNPEARSVN